jgi:cyanophycinase
MVGQLRDDASREDRLDKVVALYLEDVERGESPDALAYVEQYPDVAPELLQFFADRAAFRRMAGAPSPLEAAGAKPRSGQNEPISDCDLGTAEPARPMRCVGDYELLEEIARGGMGVVYKARQTTLNRVVALKMILAGQLASAGDVKRFRLEAEAAAQLDHPGIVPIYDVGEHDGQHYFSMGYVEGQSLAARVAQGPLPPREAAELVCAVAEAVDYAHRKGVIHRDLKPGNILLQRSEVGSRKSESANQKAAEGKRTPSSSVVSAFIPKVTDFGLAKRVEGDSSLTGSGQILGTPSYMPPEQAAGKLDQVGVASDVYSLGAVLYCLLTGRPPFQSPSVIETLMQVLEQEPLPPRQLNPTVPRDLETICLVCLRKEPERRYASARELAADLRRMLSDEPIYARRMGVVERTMKAIKRRPAVSVASSSLIGFLLFAALFVSQRQDADRAAGLVNEPLQSDIDDVPSTLETMHAPGGTSVIIGGSLRPDNVEIFQHMIECVGGREHARIEIFRCASRSDLGARRMREQFVRHGIAGDRVAIVDLAPENAEKAASAETVHEIRSANAAFFVGGDQSRITRSLLTDDGASTPALDELKALWRRGGVIAGSSAGAATQGNLMLSVSGLSDSAIDEGMDALDFGVRRNRLQRGVLVGQGLGLFPWGIIDQHFGQSRGRLGRLARALLHERVRFGFGVDENTAMAVSSNGWIKVLGTGNVTIVDTLDASCDDGPLGCRISGLRLSLVQRGDLFDAAHCVATIRPEKTLIQEGSQDLSDNHLIRDIAAPDAVRWALIYGLAENACRKQEGVTLHDQRTFGHGYRFTFEETEVTKAYGGHVDQVYSYALTDVQLAIEPIVDALEDPRELLPVDLPDGDVQRAMAGLWFRGILLADDERRLRPADAITRAELAAALAQAVHLLPSGAPLAIDDVPASVPWADDVQRVIAAELMKLDEGGRFRPDDDVSRLEAAKALVGLAERSGAEPRLVGSFAEEALCDVPEANREMVRAAIGMGLQKLDDNRFDPAARFTRQEAAEAICRAIGVSW